MNPQFTRPMKTALVAMAALAAILCAGECVVLSRVPAAAGYYGSYVAFLLLSVPIGGFVVYAAVGLSLRRK